MIEAKTFVDSHEFLAGETMEQYLSRFFAYLMDNSIVVRYSDYQYVQEKLDRLRSSLAAQHGGF